MSFNTEKNNTNNVYSKIPTSVTPCKRSASFKLDGGRASSVPSSTPVAIPGKSNDNDLKRSFMPLSLNRHRGSNKSFIDDDLESIGSVVSNFSTATTNSTCEHAHFAKNGTTYSGKSHKYIVHCSSNMTDPEEYLTPTQRANRNIKKLKSLLQLAKEKLREKEREIFMLNKEVVELKIFKAARESVIESPLSPDKDPLNISEGSPQLSPIKHVTNSVKMIDAFSQDEIEGKIMTPDFHLSSLADSGNFEDLTSSASFHSKDSIGFLSTPEPKQESTSFFSKNNEEDDMVKVVRMYEKKLGEKKAEYEEELNRVISEQQQRNLSIIQEFEKKLKEEEVKFETRWNELLKATEEEKILIINRFEEKLEEERNKYKESINMFKSQGGKVTEMVFDTTYSKKVEEEKTMYETSLIDIKQKFEIEKLVIEEKFDNAMKSERIKFEESLKSVKEVGDMQVSKLSRKIERLEAELMDILPKYEQAKCKSEELEKENESLRNSLREQEEVHKRMYLKHYKKTEETQYQEGESSASSCNVSIPELFTQLKITEVELENLKDKEYRETHSGLGSVCLLSFKEAISLWMLAARKAMYKRLAETQAKSAAKEKSESDPEATLQFLKSAVYYFLTDRENHVGHLKAIESILGYNETEKTNIEKVYLNKY